VPNCEVFYVKEIHKSIPAYYKRFSRWSTPTAEKVTIANYRMWTERGGAATAHVAITVNGSTATGQTVDLLAP
jgi:hypothetical protein